MCMIYISHVHDMCREFLVVVVGITICAWYVQGAWAIRKSTIQDVVRSRNRVTNDFTDKTYSKVSPIPCICKWKFTNDHWQRKKVKKNMLRIVLAKCKSNQIFQGLDKYFRSNKCVKFWSVSLWSNIGQVAFLFADPLSTAVVEKGLTSRGLSVEKARKLVNNERRMRWRANF